MTGISLTDGANAGFIRRWILRYSRRWPGPGLSIQIARRSVQLLVLALLVAIPVLSLYDHLRNQRDEIGIENRWDTRTVHRLVGGLEDHQKVTQAVRGSVWTMKIGSFVISDPLAVVDFVAASRVLFDAFLLTAIVPVLLSLLLGRVFCGWLCPADLLFEGANKIRAWTRITTDVTFSRATKYALLAIGLGAGAIFGFQMFAGIYPPRIVSGELYLWITFGVLGAGSWLFIAIVAFEIFVSKRFWCRYICPGGALYSLLGYFRVVRLKLATDKCTDCRLCNTACEFGLDPMHGRFGAECNNCALCIRACGHDAIVWSVGLPPKGGVDVAPASSRCFSRDGTNRQDAGGTTGRQPTVQEAPR